MNSSQDDVCWKNQRNEQENHKEMKTRSNEFPPPPVSSQWRSISDLFLAADDVITHPLTVRSGRLFCVPHCVSTCYEPFFFGGRMNENSPSTWPIPSKASLFPLLWLFLCESNRSLHTQEVWPIVWQFFKILFRNFYWIILARIFG